MLNHGGDQQQVPDERVDLKDGVVVATDPVVDGESRLQERPIRLVQRQDAECRCINE
jgi:hypothetical protein